MSAAGLSRRPLGSSILDGSQDRADRSSILRASLGMRKNNDSVPVEDEITPQLASVLTAMQTWDVPLQECSGVEGHDAGMCVGPQKGCPPKCKASVAVPVRIKRDHEG